MKESHVSIWGKNIPGWGSKCKGPEAETCDWNDQEASATGAE